LHCFSLLVVVVVVVLDVVECTNERVVSAQPPTPPRSLIPSILFIQQACKYVDPWLAAQGKPSLLEMWGGDTTINTVTTRMLLSMRGGGHQAHFCMTVSTRLSFAM